MPVTVVWGTADPVLPFSQSKNLPAGFAFTAIAGAGHMLPVEARKAVTAARMMVTGPRTLNRQAELYQRRSMTDVTQDTY